MKKIIRHLLFLGIFLFSFMGFSQTIDSIFPTRVTTTSKVTIIGSGFTTETYISIDGIGVDSRVFVNSGEMTFEISEASTTNISNKILTIGSGNTIPATETIDYIAPENKTFSNTSHYFYIKEIYTNWDNNGAGFWRSDEFIDLTPETYPNDNHELLGYRMENGIIYSTGVDDDLLEEKLLLLTDLNITASDIANGVNPDAPKYRKKVFKAYSTNGVQGKVNGANFILAGDLIDNGITGSAESTTDHNLSTLNEINNLTIFDVIIDGKHGLDLGTGIANFNNKTDVRFYSGNGQPGAISDYGAPDLLISQVAHANGSDIYYYADNSGNVVGWPIKLKIQETDVTLLSRWRLDLYGFTNGSDITDANPRNRSYTSDRNQDRQLRMAAFKLEDFGIASDPGIPETYIGNIDNVNMAAGGGADIAFMAYNKAAFDIKVPIADPLTAKYVCKTDGSTSVTFTVNAGTESESGNIETSTDPDLVLRYEWLHYNEPTGITSNSLTIDNILEEDLGTYKVKIANNKGTIIMPVSLSQGGTPYIWNGANWSSPYATVDVKERGLVFISDYNEDINNYDENVSLEGCDCQVVSGVNVTIPEGKFMKLYGSINVEDSFDVLDEDGVTVIETIPAGTFTLENNASLIQTKIVTENENIGAINVKRIASDLQTYDYVYWSSPVTDYHLSSIPGSVGYEWDTKDLNTLGSTGDWLSYTGVMNPGQGYIKRVPSSTPQITTTFNGKPNNGPISINVYKSPIPVPLEDDDKNWNLLGNPYPSAINAVKFLNENTNIEGAVYLWNQTSAPTTGNNPYYGTFALNYGNQYITHNGSGSTPPNPEFGGNIASGQGFFVKVDGDSQVHFTNSLRYDEAEVAYGNSQFYRTDETNSTATEVQKELVWLSLVNEANTSSVALVGYVEGATNERDRLYDAVFNGEGMSMYSVLEDSKMVIQGRAFPFEDTDSVALGIDIPENGIYRIGIEQLQGEVFLTNEQAIYLEDTYTNVIHDLRESPYAFSGLEGSTIDRFILRYTSERLNVDVHEANDTFVYIKDQQFYLKSTKKIKSIQLYDVTGKQLPAYKVNSNSDNFNAPFQYPRGVYITVIKFEDNVVITKKLIN